MNREIKFKAWDIKNKIMWEVSGLYFDDTKIVKIDTNYEGINWRPNEWSDAGILILMQFTGLKDKNGLTDIFEGDIIDREGNIIGNQYENSNLLQEKTNLIIQGFGTKDWCSTYQKALDRGCQNSE